MGWQTTGDVAGFLAAAGSFLRADRVRNTVILTVAETARVHPGYFRAGDGADPVSPPLFGWWRAADDDHVGVAGAFLHTPPFPVLLSAVQAGAAADLARTLAGRPVAGVNATEEVAAAFAASWRASTGCQAELYRRMRLYRLAGLDWPDPLPGGGSRTAGEGDAALLTDWFTAFAREVHDTGDSAGSAAHVREKLSYGGLTLWEAGGKPVCVAGLTRRVAGMVRVGPVYTPPPLRGRGYASATTAEASRAALAAGADEVVLFTDLANPVSNSIYQRIGYREVEDRVVLSFAGQ